MLPDRRHTRAVDPLHKSVRQPADAMRILVKRAIIDDAAAAIAQIEDRRKTEINTDGPQFRGHEPTALTREFESRGGVFVIDPADHGCRGQLGKAAAKALYAPAFVIDTDEQIRRSQRVKFRRKRAHLFRISLISRKKDHATNERMAQDVAILRRQGDAVKIGHQRTKAHMQRFLKRGDLICLALAWG
jgi:hypothetical protein